jgi:hypothetical protein
MTYNSLSLAMIREHLAQAEQHVALGERHVRHQREIVGKLQQDGHDAQEALKLLAQFEDLQAMHVADRDRLRKELEASRNWKVYPIDMRWE